MIEVHMTVSLARTAFTALALVTTAQIGAGGRGASSIATSDADGQGIAEWRQARVILPAPIYPGSGSVSPDGQLLATITDAGLAVVDLATKRDRVAVPNENSGYALSPHWSPNGRELAYSWQRNGLPTELRIMPRDGGPSRAVIERARLSGFHGWSRDGQFLLAHTTDSGQTPNSAELVVVTVADGSSRTISTRSSTGIQRAVFSPDGRFVAFNATVDRSRPSSITIVDVAAGQEDFPFRDSGSDDLLLDWLASEGLVFVRDGNASVVRMNGGRPVGAPSVVAREAGAVRSLGFTADHKMYLLKTVRDFDLYVAPLDPSTGLLTGPLRPLAEPRPDIVRGPPVWSPSGAQVGFAMSGGIWTVRDLNGAERQYRVQLENMSYPSWEPDGNGVVVRAADSQKRVGLFRIDLMTEAVSYLGPGWRMLFSQQTRDVVIVRPGAEKAMDVAVLQNLDTGAERILDIQGPGRLSARSHNGRLIAIYEAASRSVAIVPIDGGPRRTLASQVPQLQSTNLEFSPDDRFIYFVAGSPESTVWQVAVDGGAPRSTGVVVRFNHDMSLSPDGRQLVIKSHWRPTELWIWERE